VLVLTVVLLAASVFAFWGLRGETTSAGTDRLARQLFDCAEQGLAVGKQYFSTASIRQAGWPSFFRANICGQTTNLTPACKSNGGPFPTGGTDTPPANYPNGSPFTNTVTIDAGGTHQLQLTYTFGLYNVPTATELEIPATVGANDDGTAVVYARCTDGTRTRSVQALITVPNPFDGDYKFTDANGMRGQNNFNN